MDLASGVLLSLGIVLVGALAAEASAAPRVLETECGDLWSVAYSPDGATLATAGAEGVIQLWDSATLAPGARLEGHTGLVRSVAFSPDGARLVSAGFDHALRIWDPATGDAVGRLDDSAPLFFPCFGSDGASLYCGSEENAARVWDLAAGTLRTKLEGHADRVWATALSPDGSLLATGSRDGTARLWDARSGNARHVLVGPGAQVTALAFSPDGKLLAVGGTDNTVRLWNPATGALVRPLVGHSATVHALAFSPDGTTLATVTADGIVRLWDPATGYFLRALRGGGNTLAFAPDGSTLATGGAGGKVTFLDWRHALAARAHCVDLVPRMTDWGLVPRGQGARNTCSVFTTVGTIEWALAARSGAGVPISPEFANWAGGAVTDNPDADGNYFHPILEGLETYGACAESEMPYRPALDKEHPPTEEVRASAAKVRDVGLVVHWINPWTPNGKITRDHFEQIRTVLEGGHPVGLGSYHSVLAVGYVDDPEVPGGGALLIRDSGGPGHYIEISYEETMGRFCDVFWVE